MVSTIRVEVPSSWNLPMKPRDSPCETNGNGSTEISTNPPSESEPNPLETEGWQTPVGFFEDIQFDDNIEIEFHGLYNTWRACLGCAGTLDILACLVPLIVHRSRGSRHHHPTPKIQFHATSNETRLPQGIVDLSTLLDQHSATINFIFSFMWFLDAFFVAQTRRHKVLLEEEKAHCLGLVPGTSEPPSTKKWWETARFVYYRSMFLQLLILPVGFYYLLVRALDHWFRGGLAHEMETIYQSIASPIVHEHNEDNYHQPMSINTNFSVLYAIMHFVYWKVSGSTTRAIHAKFSAYLRKFGPTALWEVCRRAITNPRQLQLDIMHIQAAIRWVKYLGPLFGTFSKLKENAEDMARKYRQRKRAKKVKRVRQLLWAKNPVRLRKKDAARIIQRTFRSYRFRKAEHALMVLQYKKKCLATIKVQRALRNALKRARIRLQEKKKELLTLREKSKLGRHSLNHQERRRFYQLQDELAEEAQKLINRRLLLRPNTRFAVLWKATFIICILVEMAQQLATPQVESYKRFKTGKPMTMPEFIAISFTPTRASQRPECNKRKKHGIVWNMEIFHRKGHDDQRQSESDVVPWYCKQPGQTIQEAYSDIISLLLVPAVVSDWPVCRVVKHRPWQRKLPVSKRWYCYEPYKTAHQCYRTIFDFLLEEFLLFVSIVCFLDVFVSFFTGEIDEVTGESVPKPFVARWITPGLLLQLLVNPELGDLARFLGKVMDIATHIGLERVFRWSVATIFPVAYFGSKMVIQHFWMPLVQYENHVKSFVHEIL